MAIELVNPSAAISVLIFCSVSGTAFSQTKVQKNSKTNSHQGKSLKLKITIPAHTYPEKGIQKGIFTIKAIMFRNKPNNCTKKGANCPLF